ncbi:unnamed protein product [Schistosoma mattheei]|uniref:Uncharacterized protein n=1 Tax=Schistosoma mattheei TaxID=31246 RepID=A0A183NM03_9TREM|nr:unnamed protein product [Schistosoma mattheei]
MVAGDERLVHTQYVPSGYWNPCAPLVCNQGFLTPLGELFVSTNPVKAPDIRFSSSQFLKKFIQSFNRANLRFEVRPKKLKNCTKEIIDVILNEFPKRSGIVYCLSRRECDVVAEELKAAGLQASAYHAGMTDAQRRNVQQAWIQEDKCKASTLLSHTT